MAVEDRIHAAIAPVIADLELELVDFVYGGGRLKITIDHPGGLDTERLTKATRLLSHELDAADPISGTYTLEITSPGIERPLRTPAHFRRSIGEQVAVKLYPNDAGLRRVRGALEAADDDTITVQTETERHVIPYDQINKARTVFEWGPAPKPGKSKSKKGEPQRSSPSKG